MALGDFFRRPRVHDPRFGELTYSRGRWTSRTATCLGEHDVALSVPGSRESVAPDAQQLLEELERRYALVKAEALPHLEQHYRPYAENVDQLPDEAADVVRRIRSPEDLWGHVKLVRVWIDAYGTPGNVELAYETAWDVEHTIGINISGGSVTGLCGSVGPW